MNNPFYTEMLGRLVAAAEHFDSKGLF